MASAAPAQARVAPPAKHPTHSRGSILRQTAVPAGLLPSESRTALTPAPPRPGRLPSCPLPCPPHRRRKPSGLKWLPRTSAGAGGQQGPAAGVAPAHPQRRWARRRRQQRPRWRGGRAVSRPGSRAAGCGSCRGGRGRVWWCGGGGGGGVGGRQVREEGEQCAGVRAGPEPVQQSQGRIGGRAGGY